MIKIIAIAGGLAGAAGLSQYPAFSAAYTQRLAGQVDALAEVVADFDATAMKSGLTRSAALAEMTGSEFLTDRQADLRRTFRRYAVLDDNLALLRAATPMQRMIMPHRQADIATLSATWSDFEAALPLSTAGAAAGGAGFLGGYATLAALFALLRWPLRRMRAVRAARKAPLTRREPPPLA